MGKPAGTDLAIIGVIVLLMAAVFAHARDEGGGSTTSDEPSYNRNLDFAQVQYVKATEVSADTWRFDVTVRHNDQGWDHYADAWQVIDPQNGEILGERLLAHPHNNEQPFTRSQSGIVILPGLNRVAVRARCNVHGFGGREVLVDLSRESGEGYRVQQRR
jgi:hypothetical protein